MARVDRINSIYDVSAIKAEHQTIKKAVGDTIAAIQKANSQRIDMSVNSKSLNDLTKKVAELDKTMTNMNRTSAKAVDTSIKLAKQKQAEAKATEATAKATIAESKANEQLSKEKANTTKQGENLEKQKAREAKTIDQAIDDYLQLSKAYNDAALRAKNYALRLGETHPITLEAIKDANDMSVVLKRLDATVGQHGRNVGNYKSAFDGLGMSFTQVARELPSLTISVQQFALAISNNLPMVFDELQKTKQEIAALKAEGKEAPGLFQRVGKALLSWQVGLSVGIALLTAYAGKLVEWGAELINGKKSTDALAESQKKLADAMRDVNQARQDSISYNKDSYDLETQMLRNNLALAEASGDDELKVLAIKLQIANKRKALADTEIAHQTQLAEQEKDARDLQKTGLDAVKTALNQAEIGYYTYTQSVIDLTNARAIAIAEGDKKEEKSLDKQIEAAKANQALNKQKAENYRNALKEQVDADADINNTLAEIEAEREKKRKEAAEKAKKLRERDAQAAYELEKANIELDIEFDEIRYTNEKKSYFDRITALHTYGLDKARLIELDAAYETSKSDQTAKEIIKITNDRNNALIKLAQELSAKMAQLTAESFKVDTSGLGKMVEGLPQEIQKALDEFSKAQKKAIKEHEDALKQLKKNTKQAMIDLASELENLFFDIFTNDIERQKNAVQDQIDLIDVQKQKEIELVNQTITNAQEKEAALALIDARAENRKNLLEQKQRQLDQQKARFEKARAVTEIVQSTSLAVVNALSQVKTLGFGAIALAALIGTLGAVQIARVIAQPIPKYKDGTDFHKGGLAIVGDGGRHEGIELPDGSFYKSPAVATTIDLPRGSKVYKDYNKAPQVAGVKIPEPIDVRQDLKDGFTSVVKAVKKIPQPIIKSDSPWKMANRTGSTYRNYINKHL